MKELSYQLHNESLERAQLGFLLDKRLIINKHVENKLPLLVYENMLYKFRDPLSTKSYYVAVVMFGYANRKVHINRIAFIQKRFAWCVFCKFDWQELYSFLTESIELRTTLRLGILANRRRAACALFVLDILSLRVNIPFIM